MLRLANQTFQQEDNMQQTTDRPEATFLGTNHVMVIQTISTV